MSCPYVLKFNGVFDRNGMLAVVTPWMPRGNITEYLKKNPNADRLRLVSLNVLPAPGGWLTSHLAAMQLVGVVKGVKYLHSCNVPHGGIKAVSPLVRVGGSILKPSILSQTSSFRTRLHPEPCSQTSGLLALRPTRRGYRAVNRARCPSWPPSSSSRPNSV